MIRITVNILTNTIEILKRIDNYHFESINALLYSGPLSISIEKLFELSLKCGWVKNDENTPQITERGQEILGLSNYEGLRSAYCVMLYDVICYLSPIWKYRIPYGRKEAFIMMSQDEQACFCEAGLMDAEPQETVIRWWDRVSSEIRGVKDEELTNTGRVGEQLTMIYEKERTGILPTWVSINSNVEGYDILSYSSSADRSVMYIEVKTSTVMFENAVFYLTRNEWDHAVNISNYYIYLWHIANKEKKLAIISNKLIADYIPIDQSSGMWENVKIPFSAFSSEFQMVD